MDLRDEETLRQTAEIARRDDSYAPWVDELAQFIKYVAKADRQERCTRSFHERIWENNPVSGVGMGTVNISSALDDEAFREWFADESLISLPTDPAEAQLYLDRFFSALKERVSRYSTRTPWVKMLRVMAALFPQHFTTICTRSGAIQFHRALFGTGAKRGAVRTQFEITQRLSDVLGEPGPETEDVVKRMTLAWRLHSRGAKDAGGTEDFQEEKPGKGKMVPLPASQRRKGLTSIRGGMTTLVNAVSFADQGVTKEELIDHLRSEFPEYRESSLATLFNILKNEFHVIQQQGDKITSTARGQAMLDSNEPDELFPVLLTRVLGFDAILKHLQNHPGLSYNDALSFLKTINPGWTTTFAPSALIGWLREFGLMEIDADRTCHLTESGSQLADQIEWEPEALTAPPSEPQPVETTINALLDIGRADLGEIVQAVSSKGLAFPEALVQRLHFGLWADEQRHFAVLAGLSGSGKTALALQYGRALAAQFTDKPGDHVFVQAVEPGWHDRTHLFGYINPLVSGTYVRSNFLEFLLQASRHPDKPFVLLLDEMNLSHPEQYLAPILSAIETGEPLHLHNEGETLDGVPRQIPYPANIAFIGTVNMDETTHGLSDKILDRAFTLEFWDIDLDQYPGWDREDISSETKGLARTCLCDLVEDLSPVRLHFGWRTIGQVLNYLAAAESALAQSNPRDLLDDVIYARVLPKLRGTESERLMKALDRVIGSLEKHQLTRSAEKVRQLRGDLNEAGFMRFWH